MFLSAPFLTGAAFLCVSMGGCIGPMDGRTARVIKPAVDEIVPEYINYVKNDPSLSEYYKMSKTQSAELVKLNVDTAAKLAEP